MTTVLNTDGEAVVQHFTGKTDVLPFPCCSFKVMDGDNSQLAAQCVKWGNDGITVRYAGKWGHNDVQGNHRMYKHAAFVANKYHTLLM